MKTIIKTLIIMSILSIGLLWLPGPAQAAIPERLVIGGNYTLEEGETLDDDLLVIGGLVTLQAGSTLNGEILMVGGSLEVSGQVNGDIIAAGGMVRLTETAVVSGDITSAGSNLDRDPQAVIEGDIITEQDGPFIVSPSGVRVPQVSMAVDPFFNFITFFLRLILWALLAMLLALFLPNQIDRVAHTAISQPLITGGLGLLTVVVVPLIAVIIALTILLIPVSLIGLLILVLAWVFGLIALGTELGQRFAGIFKSKWHPALAAGLGTFFLMLVVNGIEALIPCLGLAPKIIAGVIGLGAVLLTRFGMQPYHPSTPAAPVLPENPSAE